MVNEISLIHSLKPGDGVELVAPSCAVSDDVIKNSIALIKSWGLVPHVQPFWDSSPPHPLYAHEDAFRFKSLSTALSSTKAKGIWVLRGGCGATRLIPRLSAWTRQLASIPAPKLFIGFSDVTALHTFLNQKWNWTTLHAPNLGELVTERIDPHSIQTLKEILLGSRKTIEEKSLLPLNDLARQHAIIEAPIIGGNHSVLQYSIGTSWQLDCRDKILFLEDINEQAYRIAERLEHFLQARVFEGAKAILFGDYNYSQFTLYLPHRVIPVKAGIQRNSLVPATAGNDSIRKHKANLPYTPEHALEDPHKIDYVLKSFAGHIDVPVFRMSGYGHERINKPLLMGTTAKLETGESSCLTISL